MGAQRDVLAGLASGAIFGLANIGLDAGIGQGIELGTANSIFQSSIVVTGWWGIYFGELTQPSLLSFFGGSALFLAGVFLIAVST